MGMDKVYICSVSCLEMSRTSGGSVPMFEDGRPLLNGDGHLIMNHNFVYRTPKRFGNEYTVIEVTETYHRKIDPMLTEAADRIQHSFVAVSAEVTAKSLLESWINSVDLASMGSAPGVGIIGGPQPTDEELSMLRAKERARCENMVRLADQLWANPEKRHLISQAHRDSAEYLGLRMDRDRPWIIRGAALHGPVECLACRTEVRRDSIVCPTCRTNQVEHAIEYEIPAKDLRQMWPEIADRVTAVRKRRARASGGKGSTPMDAGEEESESADAVGAPAA